MRQLIGDPLTWEVRLHRDVEVKPDGLGLPGTLGHARLTPAGVRAVAAVAASGDLLDSVGDAAPSGTGDDVDRAWAELVRLVDRLEATGFVAVRVPLAERLACTLRQGHRRGRMPAKVHPPTLSGVARACLAASAWMLPLVLLAVCWALPLALTMLSRDDYGRLLFIALAPALVWGTHVVLLLVHEMAHLWAISAQGGTCHRVVVRTSRLELQSDPFPPGVDTRLVAASGPGLAWALSLLLAFLTWQVWHLPPLFCAAVAGFGALHLLSLAPWFSDGRMLLRGRVLREVRT